MCRVRAQMCFSGEMTSFPRSNLKTLILKRKWQAGCGVILSPVLKLHEALPGLLGPCPLLGCPQRPSCQLHNVPMAVQPPIHDPNKNRLPGRFHLLPSLPAQPLSSQQDGGTPGPRPCCGLLPRGTATARDTGGEGNQPQETWSPKAVFVPPWPQVGQMPLRSLVLTHNGAGVPGCLPGGVAAGLVICVSLLKEVPVVFRAAPLCIPSSSAQGSGPPSPHPRQHVSFQASCLNCRSFESGRGNTCSAGP